MADLSDLKPGDCKTVPLSTMNDFVRLVNATAVRPELREAIDESWKLHEAAYRYLGRGAINEAWGKSAISDIGNDVTPCRGKDTKPGERRGE